MADMEVECAVEENKKRLRDEGEKGEGVPAQENAEKKLCVSLAEAEEEGKEDERVPAQENAEKCVSLAGAEDKGGEGEGVPAQENADEKLCVSSAEVEEEKETLDLVEAVKNEGTLAEAEAEEGVPAQENVDEKLCVSSAEAEEEKEAEKDDETLAEEEVEDEKEESPPASVGDGNLKQATATPSEAKIGPRVFTSSMEMFNCFYDLLHAWPLEFNLNKYEHLMLEDLLNKGHQQPEKKIGAGIQAFQVRINQDFYSRCYYIVRIDGSVDDFSYRKCIDNILPLPDEIKSRSGDLGVGRKNKGRGGYHDNKGRGGRGGGWGGRRGGGGRGRGNRGRGGRF